MIRIEQPGGWILIEHREHARLAGKFARHWRNDRFAPPEPFERVCTAVSRHDDAWAARDAAPFLAPDGTPAAFSSALVGVYSAFENIVLADYLAVRGSATEKVALDDPYAAILVSMHTVNLLTEQADPGRLSASDRELHGTFIRGQLNRQEELAASLRPDPAWTAAVEPARLRRAFEFLQACDSLSLAVCVRYPRNLPLRHQHPTADGTRVSIECQPAGGAEFHVRPWPFDAGTLEFTVPCRRIAGRTFANDAALRAAFAGAAIEELPVRLFP